MVNNCEIGSMNLNKMPPIHTKQNETFMLCNCIYLYNTLWFDRHQILNHKTLCPSRSNWMTMTDDRSMEGRGEGGGLNDCRGWCKRSVIEGQKHSATQQSANNTKLFLFPFELIANGLADSGKRKRKTRSCVSSVWCALSRRLLLMIVIVWLWPNFRIMRPASFICWLFSIRLSSIQTHLATQNLFVVDLHSCSFTVMFMTVESIRYQ